MSEINWQLDYKNIGNSDHRRIEEILNNSSLMKKLVEEKPDEAIRIFNIIENRKLGEMICECYKGSPGYEGTIRDIRDKIRRAGVASDK